MPDTVVVVGELHAKVGLLATLACNFGWRLAQVDTLVELAQCSREQNVIAILFDPQALNLPWRVALGSVLEAAPLSFPIVCRGFADKTPWSEMSGAGAFHSVNLPIDADEVRQSFGFVWAASLERKRVAVSQGPQLVQKTRAVA
jgi:hypothetical protein